ncbi:gamma carbonic anhydrase family protein [SAR92 clade bacterium H231]|jgi:carbonic anhydrase/acetyltransferase-like protein (isoleucine patch superfamily)|nr:gamma carbonic anhydrase family protein [Porticoccaceae bacterium]MCT2533325.1 gamma carbonic anhydrase family protein [SAR92 clade bacterium H231]MBT7258300.1 gamma carbonic anhydrase family protein [Porticoccaceae bacterium]MBT7904988.1 gamma carbonic anhydrase family protein [Porticoccaceae bacterium]MDA7815614.1 gamma carbonic anhydrase family protein [Porticoccaceae bacterium]
MIYRIGSDIPEIHESVFVAESADVMGKVVLKKGSSVWFNAVIRGDCDLIEVGERSNIQDGAVLHCDPGQPLIIGEDVTVGHNAMIHGLEVGDRTLVGINAVILDGAKVGSDCIIGANTLVKAGAVIPDGSLVIGSPGKVVRENDEQTRQFLLGSAAHYVEKGLKMVTDLVEVKR